MDSLTKAQLVEIEPTVISIISLDRSLESTTDANIRGEILNTKTLLFEELVQRISNMVGNEKAQSIANLAIEEADLHVQVSDSEIQLIIAEITQILNANQFVSQAT